MASRAVALALAVGVLLALGATSAMAVVRHLRGGHAISYRPLRGARAAPNSFARGAAHDLTYHGGPIMPSNTNYAFYWDPAGAPAYPAEYQSGINRYLEDLAKDSGGAQNVDSVATQYGDSTAQFANYDSHFAGAIIDTNPYPPNGCVAAAICLTDAQLRAELTSYVEVHKLPHDLTHEYFMLTPPGVEDCFEATGLECSAGSASPVYCAYHGFIPLAGGSLIYSNDPFVTGIAGCDDGEHPNSKPSDGALQGGLSHEHNESITDPELSAWFDRQGFENGDKCRTFEDSSEFGTPLGKAANGSRFNQLINGRPYWYQQEWSNEGKRCKQRLGSEPPTVTKLSPKRGPSAGGTTVTITGTSFQGATEVRFGPLKASSFKILSATSIQAVSPPQPKGAVDVSVSTPGGASAPSKRDRFKYAK